MINIHFRIRLRELYNHPYQDIMSITEWFPVYARLKYNISLCLCGIVSKFIFGRNGYEREMRFVLLCRAIRAVWFVIFILLSKCWKNGGNIKKNQNNLELPVSLQLLRTLDIVL